MSKLKLVTIVGTRPEIIRLSETIKACDLFFDHKLIHTGQNWDYNLNEIFFKELGLRKPDFFLESVGENLGETLGNIIAKSYKVLSENRPDALLVLGDTNSCLATIAAKRLKIPIFHMEAGNRCFDQNVPEEINRKIVDHISDINLAYTEHARRYLLSEGYRKEHIYVTGSPMREVLQAHTIKIDESNVLKQLELEAQKYILVSAHREENIDLEKNFDRLMNGINQVAEEFDMNVIYSTHPRSKKIIEKRNFKFNSKVKNLPPFGFFDYINLQKNSYCVISDSGTLSEESSILNFPGVLIRTSTERPEVLDQGNIVIGGITGDAMISSIKMARRFHSNNHNLESIPMDYQDTNVSEKVVRIIESYTKIIDQVIWKKY